MGIIQDLLADRMGFISQNEIGAVEAQDRLWPCLVRCGGGRFSCPAQDVAHFVAIIDASADYVRDVSLLRR